MISIVYLGADQDFRCLKADTPTAVNTDKQQF